MTLSALLDACRTAFAEENVTLPGPATAEDLVAVEDLYIGRGGAGVPDDLRELWSTMDGLAWGGIVVWGIRRRTEPYVEGVIEANEQLQGIPADYVYIGKVGEEYLGHHIPTGRVDFMDFLADPRPGFPDVLTTVQMAPELDLSG